MALSNEKMGGKIVTWLVDLPDKMNLASVTLAILLQLFQLSAVVIVLCDVLVPFS